MYLVRQMREQFRAILLILGHIPTHLKLVECVREFLCFHFLVVSRVVSVGFRLGFRLGIYTHNQMPSSV